ncbi:small multi-drug export protein [Metallumcola ferriviriculae]|uniref:Small multi-drug export protein n=1 Tax=Metallumcola ferriviriculae TaxID=3039180 RepID=A0AAU0ULJ7_9FIRM|nr:small multi-drug export protein [Desulfitibacteraceae bacterium MK1]
MSELIIEGVRGIPLEWQVFLLSMLPVTELRAAIPIGLARGLNISQALFFGIMGNLIPVVPLLLLLDPVSTFLSRFPFFQRIFNWIFERTRTKSDKVEKLGAWGLLLFVGIPAPGTGVWTGSLIAFLLGIKFWRALWPICIGTVLAGILVSMATLGVLKLFTGELGLLLLLVIIVLVFWKYRRS